jgi:hypothetical protein
MVATVGMMVSEVTNSSSVMVVATKHLFVQQHFAYLLSKAKKKSKSKAIPVTGRGSL